MNKIIHPANFVTEVSCYHYLVDTKITLKCSLNHLSAIVDSTYICIYSHVMLPGIVDRTYICIYSHVMLLLIAHIFVYIHML